MFQTPSSHRFFPIAALALFALSPAVAEQRDSMLVEEAAYEALAAGREEQASRLFLSVLKANPESPASLAGLGFLDMRAWEFRAAEERFSRSLELAPNDPVVSNALIDARFWAALKEGDAARSQGLHQKAQDRYLEALAVKPGENAATERLATLNLPVDSTPEAVEVAENVEVQEEEPSIAASAEPVATTEPVTTPVEAEKPLEVNELETSDAVRSTPKAAVIAAEQDLKTGNLLAAQRVLVAQTGPQSEWATLRNVARKGRTQLLTRTELQSLLAAAYLGLDDVPNGIRTARAAEEDLRLAGRHAPSHLQVQVARLLLARNPFDHELHSRLTHTSQQAGLPAPAVDDLRELWIRWSIGWARKSLDRGNPERAITVLQRARGSYPREARITDALAEARQGLHRPRPRPRWNSNPGVIVIHGLSQQPVVVANNRPQLPSPKKSLSGGITIAGA